MVTGAGTTCGRRLGMVSGDIRDFQLSGSSRTEAYSYDHGRLLFPGIGWCAESSDVRPYFQVTYSHKTIKYIMYRVLCAQRKSWAQLFRGSLAYRAR